MKPGLHFCDKYEIHIDIHFERLNISNPFSNFERFKSLKTSKRAKGVFPRRFCNKGKTLFVFPRRFLTNLFCDRTSIFAFKIQWNLRSVTKRKSSFHIRLIRTWKVWLRIGNTLSKCQTSNRNFAFYYRHKSHRLFQNSLSVLSKNVSSFL